MDFSVYGILKLLLTGAFVMFTLALLDRAKRRNAKLRDGWRYLTPGPMMWVAFVGSLIVSVFLSVIYLFTRSALADSPYQMTALLTLAVCFNIGALLLTYTVLVQDLRWNDTHIQSRTWLFRTHSMTWHQLAALGQEPWTGYWWISAYDGPKIRFSPYDNGFPELLAEILENLPSDLPPAEADLVQQAVLARAG
jgi:hypothetical protein